MKIVELLVEYKDGLIGIGGTVIGIIISEVVRRVGKIKFIKENIDCKFYELKSDGYGTFESTPHKKENANIFEGELDLQIYNGKGVPKVFNKIKFIFKTNDGKKIQESVKDSESIEKVGEQKIYNEISNIKIETKSLTELKIRCYITDNIEQLKNSKMYLQYCDIDKNKIKEEFIIDLKELD